MLIDPLAEYCQQKLQYQSILLELNKIATGSIDASMSQRDQLELRLIQSIYQQDFDALFGGCLVEEPSKATFSKPLSFNCLLCDIYLTASRVLFNGQLRLVGQQLLDLLTSYFVDNQTGSDYGDKLESFKHCFNRQQIESGLTQDEQNLFLALIKKQPNCTPSEQQSFCYHNKQSLTDAAEFIGMELKQAQIIEYSLQQKLKDMAYFSDELRDLNNLDELNKANKKQLPTTQQNRSMEIQFQSQFIINLCKENFANNRILHLDYARQQLLANLNESFLNEEGTNGDLKIEVFYAAIYFLQVDFDSDLLKMLEQLWLKDLSRVQVEALSLIYRTELELIQYFAQTFFDANIPLVKSDCQIIVFQKNNLSCLEEINRFRAEYRFHRLVFVL